MNNRSHTIKKIGKKVFSATALVALLAVAGCSSSVKLDDPASIESRDAAARAQAASGANASGVKPVDVTRGIDPAGGPANIGRSVYFDYDSFVIKDDFKSVVEGQASYLRANPKQRVALEGHTDERGGSEYNLALGQKRSESVRRALALLGVPESQTEAVSFGKEKPKAVGSDETAYSQNRRADVSYR